MRFLPEQGKITAAVIGLGYVGSAVAATLAGRDVDVVGVDTDRGLIDELREGRCRFSEPGLPELLSDVLDRGTLRVTTDYSAVSDVDVVVVAVGTPIREGGHLADHQLRGAC